MHANLATNAPQPQRVQQARRALQLTALIVGLVASSLAIQGLEARGHESASTSVQAEAPLPRASFAALQGEVLKAEEQPATATGAVPSTSAPVTPAQEEASAANVTAPAPSSPPVTPPPSSSGPTRYDEVTDNTSFSDSAAGTSGSATQITRDDADGERVRFYAYISCSPEQCTIQVTIQNTSGRTIGFEDGLKVDLSVTKDGAQFISLQLTEPALRELAPDGEYAGDASIHTDGPGTYGVSGHTTIWAQ